MLAPVTPSAYGEDQTNLVPIYTDNIRLDYMVKKILDQIIAPEMSNYQKIKAVYDWIIKSCIHTEDPVCYHCENNIHYFNDDNMIIEGSEMNARDNRLLNNGEVNMIVTNGAINNNQWLNKYNKSEIDQKYWGLVFNISKAEDIMYHRRGVCSYFASLFMVMVNQLGFESGVTEGTFVNYSGKISYHVWNYIKLNGSYYWIDTDIEHLNYVNNKKIAYTYFLKKDPEWSDKHIWDKAAYPSCN